jgi:60S ribosome subunit biogenesis protein NIP7
MSFLYGKHILKAGLGRITENTPKYDFLFFFFFLCFNLNKNKKKKSNQGVVVFSMSDIPLGFGMTAKSTQDCRKADVSAIVTYHQSDCGEYLRDEETMF